MVQKAGYPDCINPHLGRLSDQLRTTPHSTDSKNLREHCLCQCQELSGTLRNKQEGQGSLNRPQRTDLLCRGPIGHVILLMNVKVASS
jgi:hypothetical protein